MTDGHSELDRARHAAGTGSRAGGRAAGLAAGASPRPSRTAPSRSATSSLDIGERQFVSLLGPSGCGKSTVLRIIAGLGEPTAGGGRLALGRRSTPPAPPEREIGFVFQEPTLMPWATAFSNVWLPLRLRGVARRPPPATR